MGHHGQVSIEGKLELPLFFLFLVFFFPRHKWVPSLSLDKREVRLPLFFFILICVLLFLGVGGHHR
jgi:hypothetical protein